MFGNRWQILRVRGIPISVDLSWLLIVALLTWTLTGQFHDDAPQIPGPVVWTMALITTFAFFGCIVLHELGHAVVAQNAGIPLRGITLFMFGGVAQLEGEPTSAGSEFTMAIAGPIVSAILAAIFGGLWIVGKSESWGAPLVLTLRQLMLVNVMVLVFNLIPAFPLDGGRVLRSILWAVTHSLRRATYWAAALGRAFAWLLIAAGVLMIFNGNFLNGLWFGLIGFFLANAAAGSYRQIIVREALQGEPVSRFMNRHPIVVPPGIDLRQWVEEYVYRFHHKLFPVAIGGHVDGVISTRALAQFPRSEWEVHTVSDAMERNIDSILIRPDTDAFAALEKMQRTGSTRLLVVDDRGELTGIVSLKDLLRFLELKLELEPGEDKPPQPPQVWQRPHYDAPSGHADPPRLA
jgi:Zn-dependent protease